MVGNFSISLKKYSVPVLFFILGILLFYAGISGKQNMTFMISAVMMFVAGVMSILYSSGSFKSILLYILVELQVSLQWRHLFCLTAA